MLTQAPAQKDTRQCVSANGWASSTRVVQNGSRSVIGEQLDRQLKDNVCLLEAMYHTLPKNKQSAFIAHQSDSKKRWEEALKFMPSKSLSKGFTVDVVRKYLMHLRDRGYIKSFLLKVVKNRGGRTSFTLGKITKGMVEYPDKYTSSIIILGAAPKTDAKPKLRAAMVNGLKDFQAGRKRRSKKAYSAERLNSQKIKLYQALPLIGSDKYTHAVGVAWTKDSEGNQKIGLYDNGRNKVVEFSVEEFRVSLMRFWSAIYFDIEL